MNKLNKAVLVIAALYGALAFGASPDDRLVPIGMSADVGGGAIGFLHQGARAVGEVGGAWTARLTIGTRSYLGGELGYIGTAQGMNALGLADQAVLVSNGAEGALRLNLLTGVWQPYAVAGIAWRHYSVTNSAFNTSSVRGADDIGEVPVGIGLAYRMDRLVLDARIIYRQALSNNLIPGTNLSTIGATAKLGFEF